MRASKTWVLNMSFCLLHVMSALAACARKAPPAQQTQELPPVLVGAENTVVVKREKISAGPRLSGSLEPREEARVRAEVSGSVTSVEADFGRTVSKGQVLARIEDTALRNAYASAQSAVTSARLELENATRQAERTEALVAGGALAQRDLEVAQSARSTAAARLAQSRAQLAQTREQLDAATVKSPLDGAISEKAVNKGDIVTVGSPLFTVIDPSSMRLRASVPSDALPSLHVGTPVAFQVRGYPDQTFEGKIDQIAPAADPTTRQITTLVSIPNPGGKLIAGLFAEGRIAAETREALVVPTSAVDKSDESPQVVRIKDGRAEAIPVTLGLRDDQTERIEVKGPIQEGDVLLSGATKNIAPGTPVKLTGPAPNAS